MARIQQNLFQPHTGWNFSCTLVWNRRLTLLPSPNWQHGGGVKLAYYPFEDSGEIFWNFDHNFVAMMQTSPLFILPSNNVTATCRGTGKAASNIGRLSCIKLDISLYCFHNMLIPPPPPIHLGCSYNAPLSPSSLHFCCWWACDFIPD